MSVPILSPKELGLDPERWQSAVSHARHLCETGLIPALALQVVTPDGASPPVTAGQIAPHGPDIDAGTIFLTASLSKPILAMGVLKLVEQGRLSLQTRVVDLLPEFSAAPKRPTTIRHLLTHTSGLPDMLPDNRALREAQAELSRFIIGTCDVPLDFSPGRGVQYQSMGYALLGEIIQRVTDSTCAEFLAREILDPLGMTDSAMGISPAWQRGDSTQLQRIAEVRVPEDQQGGTGWNWNSLYWRSLGAPWGGLLSTVGDLASFLQMMLRRGDSPVAGRLFAPETIVAATSNQLNSLPDIAEADRRTRGWGYGWRLNWTGHSATFGDLLPPETYGHWGATGTLWWVNPRQRIGVILLSTQPLMRNSNPLLSLSNIVAAAMTDDR